MNEQPEEKRGARHRSPAYPSIDLGQAIVRAREIYKSAKRGPAHVESVLEHWGYEPGSSNGLRAIAALKQFGLLEDRGKNEQRQVQLSRLALDILIPEDEGGPKHRAAIQGAALMPPVHESIWEHYEGQPPSDSILRRYLIFERNFNDASVDGFIRQFRATLTYAGLTHSDSMEPVAADEAADAQPAVYDMFRVQPQRQEAAMPATAPQADYEIEEAFRWGDKPAGLIRVPPVTDEADLDELQGRFDMVMKRLRRKLGLPLGLPAPPAKPDGQ